MNSIKYITIVLVMLLLASCHKDEESTTTGNTTTSQPEILQAVTGDIVGYVYDEDKAPVAGATVFLRGNSTTTTETGHYLFNNVELDPQGSYITAEKAGYILGSDKVHAIADVDHVSRIQLMKLDVTGTFAAASGGVVNVEGGGSIEFPTDAIVTADGSAYTGSVNVTAKRIATNDPDIADIMPGDLLGTDREGRTRTLGSMGMVAVELRGAAGQELNLAAGKTAEVAFPIAENQRDGAPDEIILWSFDEAAGLWVEEGKAIKNGGIYVGQVSHFSFWNCDAPFPVVAICGKVKYDNGDPGDNLQLKVISDVYGVNYGWTNCDGSFSGKVPKGQVLTLEIFNFLCNGEESIMTIEIGPFTNKTTLDDIILPTPTEYSVSGSVTCDGAPLAEALVQYSYNESGTFTTITDENGNYTININNSCDGVSNLTIQAIHPTTGQASETITVGADENVIDLEVCDSGCAFTVEITTDPSSDPCMENRILAVPSDAGNYSYEWSDGSTDQSLVVTQSPTGSTQYCVTVTDVDGGCDFIVCSQESAFRELWLEVNTTVAVCDGEDAEVWIWAGGGTGPYTYEWSDPSLTVNVVPDSFATTIIINPGSYSLTVTDVNGCTISQDVEVVVGAGLSMDLIATDNCWESLLQATVTGGSGNYFYSIEPFVQSQPGSGTWNIWQTGEYCVTATDELGCSTTDCITVDFTPIYELINLEVTGCTDNLYTIINNSIDPLDLTFQLNDGNTYSVAHLESFTYDAATFGFGSQYIQGSASPVGCDFGEVMIPIPGVFQINNGPPTYNSTDTSCQGCTDGSIVLNDNYLDFSEFNGAEAGSILVQDENGNNVTTAAAAGELAAGNYYVVVLDANTSCYLMYEKVILE